MRFMGRALKCGCSYGDLPELLGLRSIAGASSAGISGTPSGARLPGIIRAPQTRNVAGASRHRTLRLANPMTITILRKASDGSWVSAQTVTPGETIGIQAQIASGFTNTNTITLTITDASGNVVDSTTLSRPFTGNTFGPYDTVAPLMPGQYSVDGIGGGLFGIGEETGHADFQVTPNAPVPGPGPGPGPSLFGDLKSLAVLGIVALGLVYLGPALGAGAKRIAER